MTETKYYCTNTLFKIRELLKKQKAEYYSEMADEYFILIKCSNKDAEKDCKQVVDYILKLNLPPVMDEDPIELCAFLNDPMAGFNSTIATNTGEIDLHKAVEVITDLYKQTEKPFKYWQWDLYYGINVAPSVFHLFKY